MKASCFISLFVFFDDDEGMDDDDGGMVDDDDDDGTDADEGIDDDEISSLAFHGSSSDISFGIKKKSHYYLKLNLASLRK